MQRAPSSPTISALGVHPFMIGGERFSKVFLLRFAVVVYFEKSG
jgi:hypothetical protein